MRANKVILEDVKKQSNKYYRPVIMTEYDGYYEGYSIPEDSVVYESSNIDGIFKSIDDWKEFFKSEHIHNEFPMIAECSKNGKVKLSKDGMPKLIYIKK